MTAASGRLHLVQGGRLGFAEEALRLYGVRLELRPLEHYDPILARIERLVPGPGPLAARVEAFTERFVVPRDRVDAVMRAAIAECRRRTLLYVPLPAEEAFTLEFVTGQSWSGYNWYQGNYRSLIQVNLDFPVRLGRAIDLGCHEGYPGHHVFNMLLERELARGRGWVEYQVYPLYSPQSFIAEGSANYGIELAFPGEERLEFERRVLYPLAGIPAEGADAYLQLQEAIRALGGARFTIARDLIEGRITRDQAVELTQRYQLVSRARAEQSVAFTTQYRAYVINYGLNATWSPRRSSGPAPIRRRAGRRCGACSPSRHCLPTLAIDALLLGPAAVRPRAGAGAAQWRLRGLRRKPRPGRGDPGRTRPDRGAGRSWRGPLRAVHADAYLAFLRAAHKDWRARGRDGDASGYAWPVVRRQ